MRNIVVIIFTFLIIQKTSADTTKVLFIGNSYTNVNNLPLLFKNFSESGGKAIYTDVSAPGGYTLQSHLENPETLNLISLGIWDYIILQEQSQTPVIEYLRYNSMYPSVHKLDSIIKAYNPNSNTVLYMTWGRKNGGQQCIDTSCSPVFINFFHMQDSLNSSYSKISNCISAILSPVGEAWRKARILRPNVNLWDSDESHPTLDGSYLAACVFFAKIFNLNPIGVTYNGSLPDSTAFFYQFCAFQTVSSVISQNIITEKFELFQNYPNPFNNSTNIKFSLPKSSFATLKIYDILGKEVITLFEKNYPEGNHVIRFSNSRLPSGIYYYRLQSEFHTQTKKLVIIR